MKIIAVAGGIGAGKSLVCKILRILGYSVYDCDSEAKCLMESDEALKIAIRDTIDSQAVIQNDSLLTIDKKRLAKVVFASSEKLERLNSLVHTLVKSHIETKIQSARQTSPNGLFIFETAILFQSSLDSLADEIWWVDAPEEIRLTRLIARGLASDDARARIDAQKSELSSLASDYRSKIIINDGLEPVLPAVLNLLKPYQR